MKHKILLVSAPLEAILELLNKHSNVIAYTTFPICTIKGWTEPDKKGMITLTTDCGTISVHKSQSGHFLKVPDEMYVKFSCVADASFTERIRRYEEGQGLTWGN